MSALLFNTLEEAREYVETNKEKGTECPCCQQLVKVYRRTITSTMAAMLIMVAKHQREIKNDWTHVKQLMSMANVPTSFKDGGDFAKLAMWGFVEERKDVTDDGRKHNGYFRVTPQGHEFVRGQLKTSKYIHVFNGKPLCYSEPWVNIENCLDEKFNYRELMGYEPADPNI